MKKTQKKGLIILSLLILAALCSLLLNNTRAKPASETKKSLIGKGYIAELHITGVITESGQTYNQEWLLNAIAQLSGDSRNKAILLYLDTPGGAVYEADEVYLALCKYRKETGRPVYAYMAHMAASGGYYIACAADKILANRNTITGSIGVLFGGSVDATDLLDKLGIKSETFHAGKNKNMLNYNEPLTAEQRRIMQAAADEAYGQFTGIVAESRGMPVSDVQALADGRIYTAAQALENGLIDGVCTKEEAVFALKHDYSLNLSTPVKKLVYEPDNLIQTLLWGSAKSALSSGLHALSQRFQLQSIVQ
ncbi:MAG: signal peptide peptidase SppA [Treponema sp.]|nr:signal peptide peptidase SppA [Treponema sp.]